MTETETDTGLDEYSLPALEFGQHFAMPGIGVAWAMPDGRNLKAIEAQLWREGILDHQFPIDTKLTPALADAAPQVADTFARAREYADLFIALNPPLAGVTFDPASWHQLRGFIHGVVSGFNEDDLQGWIDRAIDYQRLEELRGRIMGEFHKAASQSVYPESLRRAFSDAARAGEFVRSHDIGFIFWAPAPKTIEKINAVLDERRLALAPAAG